MKPADFFALTAERHTNPEFFARSPFRSSYFLWNTAFLVLDFCAGTLVFVRYWERLPDATRMNVVIVMVGMLILWARALVDHRKVHSLYARGEIRDVAPGSPLDVALRAAASMTHFGMMYSFLAVGFLVLGFPWVLHGR